VLSVSVGRDRFLVLAAVALRVGVSRVTGKLYLELTRIGLDWRVVSFAMVLSVFTGVCLRSGSGRLPALRTSVNETLKEGGRTGDERRQPCTLALPLWWWGKSPSPSCCWSLLDCYLRSFEKIRQR